MSAELKPCHFCGKPDRRGCDHGTPTDRATPATAERVEGAADYSDMSREALERHAARMAQALSDDKPREFFRKYASGPMMPPSCLCCGKLPDVVAIQHAELPGIVVCRDCRDAADRANRQTIGAAPALCGSEQLAGSQGVKPWQERIGTAGFELGNATIQCDAAKVDARDAEIADLRAQLTSAQQAKEYEQRHAAESETALAQVQAQLARQSQGEQVTYKCQDNECGWTWKGTHSTAAPLCTFCKREMVATTAPQPAPARFGESVEAAPVGGEAQSIAGDAEFMQLLGYAQGWRDGCPVTMAGGLQGTASIKLIAHIDAFVLAKLAQARAAGGSMEGIDSHAFKNFHRMLCERFDYLHDEKDWRRDQVSLMEHIAKKVDGAAGGEPVAYVNGDELDNMLDDRTATIQGVPSNFRRTPLFRRATGGSVEGIDLDKPCATCNGTGVVDDGEIDCYPNGEPYMNGPVKCVKDCPCRVAASRRAAGGSRDGKLDRMARCGTVDSFLALPDESKREFFARAVEDSVLLKQHEQRFEFLHATNKDADGWEWGVARVRISPDGKIEYLWGASDHSDLDASIAATPSATAEDAGGGQ